jgi:hypothetical protein
LGGASSGLGSSLVSLPGAVSGAATVGASALSSDLAPPSGGVAALANAVPGASVGLGAAAKTLAADKAAAAAAEEKKEAPPPAAATAPAPPRAFVSDYPESLGYPPVPSHKHTAGGEDEHLVRIESLLWVLEPAKLCEPITGQAWGAVQAALKGDPHKQLCFARQAQLAAFFDTEVTLLGMLCAGRADNCCAVLARTFTYPLLVSCCGNPHLPATTRAAFVSFAKALYLDQAPQRPMCGRPVLPEQLWVFQLLSRTHQDAASLPVIQADLKLDEDGSLPCFALPLSHPMRADPNPLLSFPGHTKFFLLRNLSNGYLSGLGAAGTLVHADAAGNALTTAIVKDVAGALLSFGFQSTLGKVQDLCGACVKLLDGRTDALKALPPLGPRKPHRPVSFDPPEARWAATPDAGPVARLKEALVGVLAEVTLLRANFRVAKLLETFKQLATDEVGAYELKRLGCYLDAGRPHDYSGSLLKKLGEDFESLFVKGGAT